MRQWASYKIVTRSTDRYPTETPCVLPFGCQTTDIMNPKELGLPQESCASEGKDLGLVANQWGNLSPRKRFHTEQTTCRAQIRSNALSSVGQDCLVIRNSCPLFKPKPHVVPRRWTCGLAGVSGPLYLFLFPMWPRVLH